MSVLNRKPVEYVVDDKGCHVCISHHVNTSGYPIIKRNGLTWTMNRYLLQKKLGRPLLEGFYALHTCGNRKCINVDHLYEGTSSDNRKDALDEGTAWIFPKGSSNPRSTLTEHILEEVLKRPDLSQRSVARILGISQYLVWRIRKGDTWLQLNLKEKRV